MKMPSLMIRWKKHDDPLKQHYLSIGPYPYCISDKEGNIEELTLEKFISKVETRPWPIEYHEMLLDNIPVRLKHLGEGNEGWFEGDPKKATGLEIDIKGEHGVYRLFYGESYTIKLNILCKSTKQLETLEEVIDHLNKNINLNEPIPSSLTDFEQIINFLERL